MSDPMLPRGTDKCQCPTCRLYFNSTYAFDKHRIGKIGEKRCLTLAEMSSSGWTESPTGHLRTPRRDAVFVERRRAMRAADDLEAFRNHSMPEKVRP